jgi:peptide/nickel transport system permease protein
MRVGMLDILSSDFIRTARAKGCSNTTVVYKHALRNSLIPMVTIIAGLLPGLIGGSVIIETIFGIRGMGMLGYEAVLTRDYTLLMAEFTLSAVLTLFGILVSDLLYVMVDPRISLTKGNG